MRIIIALIGNLVFKFSIGLRIKGLKGYIKASIGNGGKGNFMFYYQKRSFWTEIHSDIFIRFRYVIRCAINLLKQARSLIFVSDLTVEFNKLSL